MGVGAPSAPIKPKYFAPKDYIKIGGGGSKIKGRPTSPSDCVPNSGKRLVYRWGGQLTSEATQVARVDG